MVGVPGRSKGCITCRKRKKGCDLKRPSCGQCETRGITCGGYDPDRVFVHAAAPSDSTLVATAPPRKARRQLDPAYIQIVDPKQLGASLPHGLANSAYREKTLEIFFSMYLPHYDHNTLGRMIRPNSFIDSLSHVYGRDDALKFAALALGTSMLGRTQGEKEWVRQGRKIYGRALQETRRALADPDRANSDAMLLVPRIGAIFEMLFGADVNPAMQAKNWRSHAQGELAILTSRGPHGFQDGLAHQIFADVRMPPIVAAIRARKSSILSSVEWTTIPWEKHQKTPRDHLVDILAGIPEVLEDIDNLQGNADDSIARVSVAKKCKKLKTHLQTWAAEYGKALAHPVTEDPIEISFSDNVKANITMLFWVAALYIYGALAVVLPPKTPTLPQLSPVTFTDALFWARRIARAVPYFLDPLRGISGAITITFPGGTAMLCLLHSGTEANLEYRQIAIRAFRNPKLPSEITDFLNSMRRVTADELKHEQPKLPGQWWVH